MGSSRRHDTTALVDEMKRSRRASLYIFVGLLGLVVCAFLALFLFSSGDSEGDTSQTSSIKQLTPPAGKTTDAGSDARATPTPKAETKTDTPPQPPAGDNKLVKVTFTMRKGLALKIDGKVQKAKRRKVVVDLAPGSYTIETKFKRKWLKQTLEIKANAPIKARFAPKKRKWSFK